jgi:hypothetical protein
MKTLKHISVLVLLLAAMGTALAQTDNTQQPQPPSDTSQPQQPSDRPVGAFGQEPPPAQVSQFPPLSSLDQASLEPNYAARSFLIPGFQVTELADTNAGNTLRTGANSFTGDTHLLGTLALQRVWRRYQTLLDYRGGASFYTGPSVLPNSQVHALDFDNRILWRTGVLSIRDSLSYLPEGLFGGGFGGASSLGGGGLGGIGGGGAAFGGAQLASLGGSPRLTNVSIIDLQNSLSPRSAFTLAGGYAFSHFTHAGSGLIDSRLVTARVGYNYALSRRNTVAVTYGFQDFMFPSGIGDRFNAHTVQLLFGHQISGRMDLILGGGPQFILLESGNPRVGKQTRISGSARASLRYRFRKAAITMGYDRYESPGSGLLAGATSDVGRFAYMRPITRRLQFMTDVGYSHNSRLQLSPAGIDSGSFDYGYVGTRLTHAFSRTWNGFLMYQFNNLHLSNSICPANQSVCGSVSDRHLIGLGVSWHPRAIRLD